MSKIHRTAKPKKPYIYTLKLTLIGGPYDYYWSTEVIALSVESAIAAVKEMPKYQQFDNYPLSRWQVRGVKTLGKASS